MSPEVSTETKNQNINAPRNFFRMLVLKKVKQCSESINKKLREIDFIFTLENKIKTNQQKTLLRILISINEKRREASNMQSLFASLYKEMQASYLNTLQEIDQLDECYEETTTTFASDEEEEKIKFKYSRKIVKKDPWWEENEIKAVNVENYTYEQV